jgi:isopenicillin N synthase-like dioxygenase
MNIESLRTEGFVRVAYPDDLRPAVLEAVEAWKKFCALSNPQKQRIAYSGDLNVSGVGYELKLEDGPTADLKEDFHLRLNQRHFIEDDVRAAGPIAVDFMEKAFSLHPLIQSTVFRFAAEVEKQFGLTGFLADTQERMPNALIRFLHYFPGRAPGEELARPHVDKGGFTLHLHESHPGLQHLSYKDKNWEPMDFSNGETAIIPAMRTQYRSQNDLRATCHRVVANEETSVEGRYSAVCFVDFSRTPYYDKKNAGRLQDKPVAFNYDMPFPEFARMFERVSEKV